MLVVSLLFLLLVRSVRTQPCNGRGVVLLEENLRCECMSGYTGVDCGIKECPHGPAWADMPTGNNDAHAIVECSGQGYCDRRDGVCVCRDLFEGAACQLLKCPSDALGNECSGHGQCVTMRWAADHWDGRALVRPNVSYELWDADMITGCLCDDGYSGFNCSQIECPRGDIPETLNQKNEIMHIECQADQGYLALTFRGSTTVAMRHDTPYGHLKKYLEDLDSIRQVEVRQSNYSDAICGSRAPVITDIEFKSEFGDLPAARLDSRDLALSGQDPVLNMITIQRLECPAGSCDSIHNCSGGIYLEYDGALTSKLSWNTTPAQLEAALTQLDTLGGSSSDFGPLNISVGGSSSLCSNEATEPGENNLTIYIRGSYGNVYNFSLINSLRHGINRELVNLTLYAEKGTKENIECSDRGWCDYETGSCKCRQLLQLPFEYEYGSSNGYDAPGNRGDCGHAKRAALSCPASYNPITENFVMCTGRGTCDNSSFACICDQGYTTGDCSLKSCPTAAPWFAEASGPNEARTEEVECAGMGSCDRISGECICRDGFIGAACERLDCPRDIYDQTCSGQGRCLPMWRLAEHAQFSGEDAGISYGAATRQNQGQWDSRRIQGCLCDSRDSRQPHAGPVTQISGVDVLNPDVGGFFGYDCSRRRCPVGDDPRNPGQFEIQTIRCTADSDAFLRFTFRHQTSSFISTNATLDQVQTALTNLSTIGSVSVSLTRGSRICDPDWLLDTDGLQVTFTSELGDLPLLSTDPIYNVTETQKGTKLEAECSRHGLCNSITGECECLSGFGSSDGDAQLGTRRDCGRIEPHGFTLNEYTGASKGDALVHV